MKSADDSPRDWIFTFGFAHCDDKGRPLCGRYVRIYGTFDDAREEMLRLFGRKWAMQYPDEESAGVQEFSLKELKTGPGSVPKDKK